MFFGIFAIILALFARHFGGVLQVILYMFTLSFSNRPLFQAAMTLINLFGGPLSGMFLFGMLFPWANKPVSIASVECEPIQDTFSILGCHSWCSVVIRDTHLDMRRCSNRQTLSTASRPIRIWMF